MRRAILAAVGIVCLGMGLVSAEETKVNFNGREINVLRSVGFEGANNFRVTANSTPAPEAGKPEALKLSDDDTAALYGAGREELEKNLDSSIQTAVKYCEKNNIVNTKKNLENLGIYGTFEEKYQFVYNMDRNYTFPQRIVAAQSDKMAGMAQTCLNQSICRVVCMTAGMGAGMAISAGSMGSGMVVGMVVGTAAGGVCMELCTLIKECSPRNLFK